jgi:hypothetical protein
MLDQALRDLAPFQEIARRNHGGDIGRLVKHHLASTDPTFRQEGQAIQAMVDAVASLRETVTALNSDLFGQASFLATRGDVEIARATWNSFVPAMSYSPEGLLFAFAVGVGIWLVFLAIWFGIARFMDVVLARGRPGAWTVPKAKRGKQ